MTETRPQQRILQLRDDIRRHDHSYYVSNEAVITDSEYDSLTQELTGLERQNPSLVTPDSPTRRVGGEVSGDFDQVEHPEPMLSLDNVFNDDEFMAWYRRTARAAGVDAFEVTIEPKIDGLAVRLQYAGRELQLAATRGDGVTGEVVTHSVRTVRTVPLSVPMQTQFHARGEVYIPKSTFNDLNAAREARGDPPYANPRNAAAGGIRQTNPAESSARGMRMWVYAASGPTFNSHTDALRMAADMGLPVNPDSLAAGSPEEVLQAYRDLAARRDSLDYEIDGMVIKVDSMTLRSRLGNTGHAPRWAIAWKFPAEQRQTLLRAVTISHGRFGKLTPVAVLDPVEVGGVTVQSATLHNEADMRRKDIREGDLVIVERAGDVIPQVVAPVNTDPNRNTPVFTMPEQCPSCAGPVTPENANSVHWCTNDECPSLLPERLKHFVSRRAMDIEHLGEHWCHALIDAGLVADPADLYHLSRHDLLRLDRMGTRSADRILGSIEASRRRPLDRILYSLGIFRLGREVSGLMAQRCQTVDEAQAMQFHQLAQIEGIGPKIAVSVTEGMASPRVRALIERLRSGAVRLEKETPQHQKQEHTSTLDNPNFQGRTFVVTGKIDGMNRDEVHSLIADMGGKTASSVTSKTDALIAAEYPTDKPSSKMKKAMDLGIDIIGEEGFRQMVRG